MRRLARFLLLAAVLACGPEREPIGVVRPEADGGNLTRGPMVDVATVRDPAFAAARAWIRVVTDGVGGYVVRSNYNVGLVWSNGDRLQFTLAVPLSNYLGAVGVASDCSNPTPLGGFPVYAVTAASETEINVTGAELKAAPDMTPTVAAVDFLRSARCVSVVLFGE